MQIPVLIKRIANNGYRAELLGACAEGATQEAALEKLKKQIQARLGNGAGVLPLEVAVEPHPWMKFAGMFDPDDPLVRDWEKAMAAYRRKIDKYPDRP